MESGFFYFTKGFKSFRIIEQWKGDRMRGIIRASRSFITMILLMGLIVLLTFTGGTVVFGASSKTKTAAGKAYRTFLRNSGYKYFRTFDMNGDGLKELVCGYDKEYQGWIYIYRYRKGKVIKCGREHAMSGFAIHSVKKGKYGVPKKCLMGAWITRIKPSMWYYKLNRKGKLTTYTIYAEGLYGGFPPQYNYHFFKGKAITKKKYDAIVNEFQRGTTLLKLYACTENNMKKYAKG